jgi:CheY-like chemotaxis protein
MTRYAVAGKILVVDDDRQNVAVFRRLMIHLGYEVLTASDGDAALQAVMRDPPDLVLIDVNMPGIDGVEVCRRLGRPSDSTDSGRAYHNLDGERGSHPRHSGRRG